MSISIEPPDLTDPQQALEVGYAEGTSLRENGAKPELLDASRDLYYEAPYRFQRRLSPYYEPWRRGFDAGYLGHPKPSLA
jgi:hypothetical protein